MQSYLTNRELKIVVVDALIDKYALAGISVAGFAWFADLDVWVKMFSTSGVMLVIVFSVIRSYEQARTEKAKRKMAERKLNGEEQNE